MEKITESEVRNFIKDALFHDYFEVVLEEGKRGLDDKKIIINQGQVWDEYGRTYFPSRNSEKIKQLQNAIIKKMQKFETASFSNFNSDITFCENDIDF